MEKSPIPEQQRPETGSTSRRDRRGRALRGRGHLRSLLLLLAAASTLAVGLPSLADILVMKDGSRVETEGPWEVKGRMVRFTGLNGTLSAVRLSEVDLEASEAATEEAERPPAEPAEEAEVEKPAEKKAPVLVITDADIPRGQPIGDGPEDAATDAEDSTRAVRVVTWDYSPAGDTLVFELTGTIRNFGTVPAENIQVFVDLIGIGDDGQPDPEVHLLRETQVISAALAPGESTDFRYGVTNSDLSTSGDPDAFTQPVANFDVRFRLLEDEEDVGDRP